MKSSLQHPFSRLFLVLLLETLAYADSFKAPFTLDDLHSIIKIR